MGRRPQEKLSLEAHIKYKIKILKQMNIKITEEQKNYLYSLKREIDVDNYCHDLMFGK